MSMPCELGGWAAEYGEPAEYEAGMEYRRERAEIEASAEDARLRREAAQSFAMADNAAAWTSREAQARAELIARCADLDPNRLRRAAALGATRIDGQRYAVQGSAAPRIVDLSVPVPCTCPDATHRPHVGPCKHQIAALLAARVPSAVDALRQLRRQDVRANGGRAA